MAEQFKKTYISVHEFVDSWEKEVYELTNLDYFIFLLINNLAGEIETNYLSKLPDTNILRLHSEETGTLSFNLGDSLQMFFEEYCFDSCGLNCPLHLQAPLSEEEQNERQMVFTDAPLPKTVCRTKSKCLYSEISTFVVKDTLLDFYQFEKGFILDENDPDFIKFADFIIKNILDTIKKQGQELLQNPEENASFQFDNLIKTDDTGWEVSFNLEEEEDSEMPDGDEWKLASSGSADAIEKFKNSYPEAFKESSLLLLLNRFSEFLTEFLEIKRIENLAVDEVQEFFTIIVVHELLAVEQNLLGMAANMFRQMMRFFDYNYDINLSPSFDAFLAKAFPEIERTFRISRIYGNEHPLVNYLLSEDAAVPALLEGFFEVIEVSGQIAGVEDIHLKSRFDFVELIGLDVSQLKSGDILHMQISAKGVLYRLNRLEMVYPAHAKLYLN